MFQPNWLAQSQQKGLLKFLSQIKEKPKTALSAPDNQYQLPNLGSTYRRQLLDGTGIAVSGERQPGLVGQLSVALGEILLDKSNDLATEQLARR